MGSKIESTFFYTFRCFQYEYFTNLSEYLHSVDIKNESNQFQYARNQLLRGYHSETKGKNFLMDNLRLLSNLSSFVYL